MRPVWAAAASGAALFLAGCTALFLAGCTALFLAGCATPGRATLTISAAASLQNAMADLAPLFESAWPAPGVKLLFNYGASGTLAQQIENGAPADAFLSAAPGPMDKLAAAHLIDPATRRDLVRNQVVLIAPQDAPQPASFADLAAPAVKLVALGDPASVPAGEYGRQVLEALQLLEAVRPKMVLAKDVRQVLSYVETGNADAGIVYATDARGSARVRVAAVAPESSHQPVVYPAAVLTGSSNPAFARAFLRFLAGPQGARVFAGHGFTPAAP